MTDDVKPLTAREMETYLALKERVKANELLKYQPLAEAMTAFDTALAAAAETITNAGDLTVIKQWQRTHGTYVNAFSKKVAALQPAPNPDEQAG